MIYVKQKQADVVVHPVMLILSIHSFWGFGATRPWPGAEPLPCWPQKDDGGPCPVHPTSRMDMGVAKPDVSVETCRNSTKIHLIRVIYTALSVRPV